MSKNNLIAMSMLNSMRDRVLFTYFKSLELAKKPITLDNQELASQVWDDLVDFAIFNKGDVGVLLEAGLEVIIDHAIDEYLEKG